MTKLQPKESLTSIEEIDVDTQKDSTILNACLWDEIVSKEIKECYIRQNLPVRRQSLQVYHSQSHSTLLNDMKSNDDGVNGDQPQLANKCNGPKRHSSLNFTSLFKKTENQLIIPTRSNSTIVGNQQQQNSPRGGGSKRNTRFSLLTREKSSPADTDLISSPVSITSNNNNITSGPEFSMETLFERKESPKQPVQRFIGLLRPSKSDQTSMPRKDRDLFEYNGYSQSLNDRTQKLSRLRHVFSRIQPGNSKVADKKTPARIGSLDQKKHNTSPALLSSLARALLNSMQLKDIIYNGMNYIDVFTGTEAVSCLVRMTGVNDRKLAIIIGRSLLNQGLFHHIKYEYELTDDDELYQFHRNEDWPCYHLPTHSIQSKYNSVSPANRSSKRANRRFAPMLDRALPISGVFSVLTKCYSPTCTKKNPCYSVSCPHIVQKRKTSQRPMSFYSLTNENEQQSRALWRYSVPVNVVIGTPDIEKKRQECIYELIYTEEDFTKDLNYMQNFWIDPLLSSASDILPNERKKEFIKEVFWNISDIVKISTSLTKDLTARQDKHTVIPCIGDIILSHAKNFEPFVIYGAHQVAGKFRFELEKKRNPRFLQFVQELERQPESRRLELNGYLTKPTARLGRYNLLLNTIHKLTPKDHEDFENIPKAMKVITQFLVQLNVQVGVSDNEFHLKQLSSRLIVPKGYNLDLSNSDRQLILMGKMKRKQGNISSADTANLDIQVFLFDHCLVLSKIKQQDQIEHYKVIQKPIPLESLSVTTTAVPPASSSSNNNLKKRKENQIHQITFYNINQSTGVTLSPPVTLIITSDSTRKLWLDKIRDQTRIALAKQKNNRPRLHINTSIEARC